MTEPIPEKVTADLIRLHMMAFVDITPEAGADGVVRWAWNLSPMAEPLTSVEEVGAMAFEPRFTSFEAARNFAIGWLRRHRPQLERNAVIEAEEGVRYRNAARARQPQFSREVLAAHTHRIEGLFFTWPSGWSAERIAAHCARGWDLPVSSEIRELEGGTLVATVMRP